MLTYADEWQADVLGTYDVPGALDGAGQKQAKTTNKPDASGPASFVGQVSSPAP